MTTLTDELTVKENGREMCKGTWDGKQEGQVNGPIHQILIRHPSPDPEIL